MRTELRLFSVFLAAFGTAACGEAPPASGGTDGATERPPPLGSDGGGSGGDGSGANDTGTSTADAGPALDASSPPGGPESNPRHRWATIPTGTFDMGSPPDEPCRETDSNARPTSGSLRETLHRVTLTHAFEMSQNEVTLRQFEAVTGYRPARSELSCTDDSCPVASVSWSEAATYCNGLSEEMQPAMPPCYACEGADADVRCDIGSNYTGSAFYECPGYRLPTEAEFEYAYRAGSDTAFYADRDIERCTGEDRGLNDLAWYGSNSPIDGERSPHPVGQKQANAWSLFDMAGNVWNWCNDLDIHDLGAEAQIDPVGADRGSRRIIRGGSYFYGPNYLRAATRSAKNESSFRSPATGIRCVRSLGVRM